MAAYTTIDFAQENMGVKTYTGTNAVFNVTWDNSVSMAPAMVILKRRNAAGDMPMLYDTTRGVNNLLETGNDEVEESLTSLTAFDSDGFTLAADTSGRFNSSGDTFVAWGWKAGTTSGITGGDITPDSYSINAASGFGIYNYEGSGGVGDTVAHGLGIVPRMMWIKSDDYAYNWQVYHVSRGNTGNLVLNDTDAFSVDSSRWDDTTPSSTVWTMGSGATVNYSGRNFMAYLWADVTGYSCINAYYGNGAADGPMIYTGFKPAWIMIKNSERATSSWFIWDDKRQGYNIDNDHLYINDDRGEDTQDSIDILSNGFKIRKSDAAINGDYKICIFAAFASNPFVNSNGAPGTSRF